LADRGGGVRFFGPGDLRSLKLHFACEHLGIATKQREHIFLTPDALKPLSIAAEIEAKKT
jgi:hypothetical protein